MLEHYDLPDDLEPEDEPIQTLDDQQQVHLTGNPDLEANLTPSQLQEQSLLETDEDYAAGDRSGEITSHRKLTDTQLDYLALAESEARSINSTHLATGLDPTIIKRVWQGVLRPEERSRYQTYRSKHENRQILAELRFRQEMTDLVDDAYAAIRNAVTDPEDAKLAEATAWKILNGAGAPVRGAADISSRKEAEATINAQFNIMSNEAADRVGGSLSSIVETFKQMSPLPPVTDPKRHLRTSQAPTVTDLAVEHGPGENPNQPEPVGPVPEEGTPVSES